mmetsp:Transcript_15843/g.23754  ORF Transcript_15843/g.23754 Transcript_15843/m.23754 type:complete len:98 (-) Transcript_15843:228-521(-)
MPCFDTSSHHVMNLRRGRSLLRLMYKDPRAIPARSTWTKEVNASSLSYILHTSSSPILNLKLTYITNCVSKYGASKVQGTRYKVQGARCKLQGASTD